MRRSLASGGRRREEEEESGIEGDPETGGRGGGKEGRRREEGRGSRGGRTEKETWGPGGGRRRLCLRTMGRGKGARGGALGGGASLRRTGVGLDSRTPLFPPPDPGHLLSVLRTPNPPPTPSNPGEPRCRDPHPQLADLRQRPVTQSPPGTWRGSSSCCEPGPPFPSSAAPPHALASPSQPLLLRGPGLPPGCGGVVESRVCGEPKGRKGVQKPTALETGSPTRAAAPLQLHPVSHGFPMGCNGEIGEFGGRRTGEMRVGRPEWPPPSCRQRARWLPRLEFGVLAFHPHKSQSQPFS